MKEFYINNKKIGENEPVYFIAEAGVNHEGNRHLARALAEVSIWAGVDALKVQTFKANLIVTQKAEKADYQQTNLKTSDSQYQMLKKLELAESEHEYLKKICDESGITFLSTPHSGRWSVDYLDALGVSAFKIASPDLTNIPHLKYIASKKKPVILSTGMGTLEETIEAIEVIKSAGNNDIIALHCTSNYPCPLNEVNLNAMQTIKEKCNVLVGYSDHTPGIEIPIMATAMGARLLEKHFTIDSKIKGNSPDHSSSLNPSEIKQVIGAIRFTEKECIDDPIEAVHEYRKHAKIKEAAYTDEELRTAFGSGIKAPTKSELKIMKGIRKSLIATKSIEVGEKLTSENTDIKRPTGGIQPRFYDTVIERKITATKRIKPDEAITTENTNFKYY